MDLLAVVESNANRATTPHQDFTHGSGASYRSRARLERGGERARDCAHAAARKTPCADRVVDVPHVVVQQHVGAARRARPQRRANDRAAGKMRLDDLALEILVEKIRGAHRPEPQRVVHALLAHRVEALAEVEKLADVAWPE